MIQRQFHKYVIELMVKAQNLRYFNFMFFPGI